MPARAITKLWPRLKRTCRRWRQDDGSLLVASVAYYAAFSLFPLLLILIAVLGFVLRFSSTAQDSQQRLLALLANNTSAVLADQVAGALAEIRTKAVLSGPLGLITLLVGAIGIFVHVEKAFDRIWGIHGSGSEGVVAAIRNVLFHRARAFLMLVGLGFLILAAFVAGMAVSALQPLAAAVPGGGFAWNAVQILASVTLNWLLFAAVYKVVPKPRVRWSEAIRGGLVAAVLWEVCRQVLALVLVGRKYSAYGVVGSLIAVMFWIYVAVGVLFFGAEYARVIADEREQKAG